MKKKTVQTAWDKYFKDHELHEQVYGIKHMNKSVATKDVYYLSKMYMDFWGRDGVPEDVAKEINELFVGYVKRFYPKADDPGTYYAVRDLKNGNNLGVVRRFIISYTGIYCELIKDAVYGINPEEIHVPKDKMFRSLMLDNKYEWYTWRNIDYSSAGIKLYYQLRKVKYADYIPGLFYVRIGDVELTALEKGYEEL